MAKQFRIQSVHLTDNSDAIILASEQAVKRALKAVGIKAEAETKKNITADGLVDTGAMRNSITNTVQDKTVHIGSNLDYAIYQEVGTGIYYPGGRKGGWWFKKRKTKKSDEEWWFTYGTKPHHFLKRAIEDNIDQYRRIIEQELKKG